MPETRIPRAALALGIAGLLPFVWGALTMVSDRLSGLTLIWAGPRFVGPYVLLSYGTVILSFMSGVLWGFATRAEARAAATGYALSVIPALWAFVFVGGGVQSAAIYLITGFVGILGIDWVFWRHDLAPPWWMRLRIGLTAVVVACLTVVLVI
ncbi:DUF3429 domain-containing protein [Psychromarinibacter sp. C21-152]|uniref:DUF3429 domain-containing protein n=1 Tax=Psychromarinibacter sediminicola TaxID=3033385 RepID=A0AAE3NL68_9RHOB|nr:DUF3429 domain-containing protein [Psychromarinibacter sediminicola]MDF0599308.1 DUF3429 domain-containing protein [Psychromarinibacter sediminicola]